MILWVFILICMGILPTCISVYHILTVPVENRRRCQSEIKIQRVVKLNPGPVKAGSARNPEPTFQTW